MSVSPRWWPKPEMNWHPRSKSVSRLNSYVFNTSQILGFRAAWISNITDIAGQ